MTSLSVNPKRARMGSLWVLDCTLYILLYTGAARVRPPKVNLGQTTTLGDSKREGRIGLN